MKRELLIAATGQEARIAVLEDDAVVDLVIERDAGASLVGNIYLGHVQRVVNGIGAAFVDLGFPKAAFLPLRGGETVTEGEAVRVQVTRDAFGDKGPQLTLNPTLPGRLLVYSPDSGKMAVSRQIDDEEERERLLAVVGDVAVDEEGFIVRTVAEGADRDAMVEEADRLREAWDGVVAKQAGVDAPAVLYSDLDLLQKALRDHAQDDVSAIWFEDAGALADARVFCERFAPGLVERLKLHKGAASLFDSRNVDEAVDAALQPRVPLPSGGSIVVESTEALTVVDVNSGRFTEGTDPEDSARRTNLEAADEIARQLRLRNVGGVIVVDFIDMLEEESWTQVIERLERGFQTDRIHCRVLGKTEAGLVELIRRRRRPPLAEILLENCYECGGTGLVKMPASIAFDVLRALRREAAHGPAGPLSVDVGEEVAEILHGMGNLSGIVGRVVTVHVEPEFAVDEFDIYGDEDWDGD